MKLSKVTAVAATALVAVSISYSDASAGTVNQPYKSGNNANGWGSGFTTSDYHDMDRNSCGFWGCSWNDGTNVYFGENGSGVVSRGMACGSHDYRHQASDGGSATKRLELVC